MSTRYKRTNWVRRLEDFSSGSSSGFALGRGLMAGLLAMFTVPVVSTTGASSLKSPASIWRGVVFIALLVGLMAMGRGAWAFSCTDVTEIPKTECEVLVDLYNSTDGANWTNNSGWNETNTPCSWYGVECSDGHVTTIKLGMYRNGNNLNGSLPESLGNLSHLVWLCLETNKLSGSIPDSLSNLSGLMHLDLDRNQLSGSIPEWLGNLSNFYVIQLTSNQLSGSIPESLGNLSSYLEFLELGNNQLSGSIPESLGNLSDLRRLHLGGNQLSGSIPESLGNLSRLQWLYLYNNELCGDIPLSLMNTWLNWKTGILFLKNNHLNTPSNPDMIDWLNDLNYVNLEDQTPCTAPKLATTSPSSICNGDSFDVTFQTVKTDSQPVDTVTINLSFDPATLKFNSLTNSGVLDFEMTNKHDNGSIEFTAGVWDNPVQTQTFDMFTVNFTALQATETTLAYDTSQSSLTSEGESIPYFAENGQLTVSNCFGYQVDLQRKNPKPDNSWETALEISIGSQTNATKYNDTSDQNGQGNIAVESTLGNQDYICVKNAHTLANKIEAPIDINNIVDFGTLLEGDSNGDNVLSVNDFSQVFQSKGKCTDDTGFNANADFNVDGCVTMDDAKFLKESPIGNLGKTSACTWNSSLSMLRRGTRDGKSAVTLGTTTIPTGLTVGDTFDYVIKVQAGTQLVDTTGAYLNFDPKLLKVNTMLQGETFDFVLQSSFDNELGNIDFAAGVWDHEIPKGTFTLVTINFTVLSVGGEETLSFNTTGNRVTTTVSGGSSVTAQDESGEPVIEEIEEPVIEEPTGNYTASGIIRDKEGNPIAGVNVQVGDKTAVTNDKGEWEITGLQEGDDYTATASKDGYTFAPIEFALGNDEFTQTVVMKPLSALNVKVIAEPSAPKQGENITFIATVTNGGSETATGVALTNVLSNGISLVSIEALDGGECDTSTVTCTLPDLTTGATAKVKLAVNNSDANKVANEATVTSNEYPADVHKKSVNITPHLSVSVNCAPKTVEPKGGLHCTAEVVLSSLAPSAATGINLVMTLPNGVELQSLNTDYGMCDTSEQPILTCSLTDLSVDSPDDISRVAVSFDSVLQDPGLLALTHAAKVTANEYPAHTTRARTKVFIPPEYQVDLAIVIDVTGSMQQEMNSTKNAVNKFIADLEPSQVPLTALVVFRDEVTVKAVTTDLSLVETAINKMKASGGGTCPEASVEALDVAITHVKEGGTIFFVTDASPYEDADVAGIVERMKTKGIIFNAIVTGDCSNKESWNVLP